MHKAIEAGVINADACYTLAEFKNRTGLKDWAVRKARRAGLRIHRLGENGGGAAFVIGKDWIDFLQSRVEVQPTIGQQAC